MVRYGVIIAQMGMGSKTNQRKTVGFSAVSPNPPVKIINSKRYQSCKIKRLRPGVCQKRFPYSEAQSALAKAIRAQKMLFMLLFVKCFQSFLRGS